MADDVHPIKRRTSGKSPTKDDDLLYLQREVMPELKAIRALLDRMQSAPLQFVAAEANVGGLSTDGVQTSFSHMFRNRQSPSCRITFDASQYPATNMSKVRRVDVDYWLDADASGGSPELALFKVSDDTEITGSRASHTTGTTSSRTQVTGLALGDGADELPEESIVMYVKARDVGNVARLMMMHIVMYVRYVDPDDL